MEAVAYILQKIYENNTDILRKNVVNKMCFRGLFTEIIYVKINKIIYNFFLL